MSWYVREAKEGAGKGEGDLPVVGCGEIARWGVLGGELGDGCYGCFGAHCAGVEDAGEVAVGGVADMG